MEEQEEMLAGELYDPLDEELVKAHIRARNLCHDLNLTRAAQNEERRRILQELFGAGGDDVNVKPPFFCDYGQNIFLGKGCSFDVNCVLLDECEIKVGNYTMFGPAVQVHTAELPANAELRRERKSSIPVVIGSDVRLGGGTIICPGVQIGSRAVIGAGSVVKRDVPEGVFATGNPCRVIEDLPQ